MERLEDYLKKVLKPFSMYLKHEIMVAEAIKCALFQWIRKEGLMPIPHYKPPKRQEDPLPLVAFDDTGKIVYAFAIAPIITLKAIKTFKVIKAEKKIFLTFSPLKQKLEESKFFLSPDVFHLHLNIFKGGSR